MEQFNETIEKVLSILEKYDEPFLVLQTILLALLNRKFKKLTTTTSATLPVDVPKTETEKVSDAVWLRNQFENEFKSALDLYFSGKSYADMTDEERKQINDVQTFINGG